jgi:replicative DNA helicase
METTPDRELPGNIEAERRVLGVMLMYPHLIDRVAEVIVPTDFRWAEHREISRAIFDLAAAGKPATPFSVAAAFPRGTTFGGISALSPEDYCRRLVLASSWIDTQNAEYDAERIRELAQRRALIAAGERLLARAFGDPEAVPAADLIEEAERSLSTITVGAERTEGFVPIGDAADEAMQMAAAAFDRADGRGGGLSGHATGLEDLDRLMGGLQRSDLIVIAGRPAMGKTALVTNIMTHLAADGLVCGMFSLEMSQEQVATRIIAARANVASSKIRRGAMDDHELEAVVDAGRALKHLPIHVDQTGGITLQQLATRARRLKRTHGLDLLAVDYLQLMRGSGPANDRRGSDQNRTQEITAITSGMKAIAKELQVPLIALSQLSRGVEARQDKRPMLSDLRESGSIEQDADVVIFVYRDEYYLSQQRPPEGSDKFLEWQAMMDRCAGKAELIIAKQRHGPTGHAEVAFDAALTTFSNRHRQETAPLFGMQSRD